MRWLLFHILRASGDFFVLTFFSHNPLQPHLHKSPSSLHASSADSLKTPMYKGQWIELLLQLRVPASCS